MDGLMTTKPVSVFDGGGDDWQTFRDQKLVPADGLERVLQPFVEQRMPPAVTGIWNGTHLNSTGRWVSWDAEAEEFKVGYHWGKDVLDAGRPCVLYRAVVVYRPPSHGFPGKAEVYVRRDGMTGGAKSYYGADEDTDFTSIFHGLQWVQLPAKREGNDV